jgi:hypothetical protein
MIIIAERSDLDAAHQDTPGEDVCFEHLSDIVRTLIRHSGNQARFRYRGSSGRWKHQKIDTPGDVICTDLPEPDDKIPQDLMQFLGEHRVVLKDSWCGEPIAWGHDIVRRIGDLDWDRLRLYGDLECISKGDWVLVLRWVTPEFLSKEYGPPTKIVTGPRGGFRHIVYGEKTFTSRKALPSNSAGIPTEVVK